MFNVELPDVLPCPACGSTDVYCELPAPRAELRYMVCFACKEEGPIVPFIHGEPIPNIKAEIRAIRAWNQMVKNGPKSKAQKKEEERLLLQQIYGNEEKVIELED